MDDPTGAASCQPARFTVGSRPRHRSALPAHRPPAPRDAGGADDHRTHSTLVVPLRARDSTLGVAQFIRHHNPDPFDDEDLLLAQEIAARAAVAVDNARRYTHARLPSPCSAACSRGTPHSSRP
ncbi:GAF domain-containing protein [Streptomyces puniciscabiei]|uniref:GAF domain-containing protein n=1 Tax=Streptomyces puniciscabiei TaxID=164348 RepID=UPI0033328EEF